MLGAVPVGFLGQVRADDRGNDLSDWSAPMIRLSGIRTGPLVGALRVALEPWGVDVRADGPGAPSRGAAGVEAEVDVRPTGDGRRLRVVVRLPPGEDAGEPDGRSPRVPSSFSRELPLALPLDDPGAASVALTVKTLLRNTHLAPVDERRAIDEGAPLVPPGDAVPAAAGPGEPSAGADDGGDPRGDQGEPAGDDDGEAAGDGDGDGDGDDAGDDDDDREAAADDGNDARAPTRTSRSLDARLDLATGARLDAFRGAVPPVEARLEVGGAALLPGASRRGGLALGAELAAGWPGAVDGQGVEGRLFTGSLVARIDGFLVPRALPRLVLEASAGLGGRLTVLNLRGDDDNDADGAPVPLATRRVLRFDPLVRARISPSFQLGPRLALGLRLGVAIPLRRQRFRVQGERLVAEAAAAFEGGLFLAWWWTGAPIFLPAE